MTPAQRSASASKAVRARWAKASGKAAPVSSETTVSVPETSDAALIGLLKRLRVTNDLAEIRTLPEKIEQVVFHKQLRNA
jgi:hypothetical protein